MPGVGKPVGGKVFTLASAFFSALALAPASAVAAERPEGFFNAACSYSHRAADDPIVFPGKPGAAHMHDFLGNSSTSARSTPKSLRGSPSQCNRSGDRSAYWVPTLYENGHALAPESVSIYYRTSGRDPSTIRPFPLGLRVIAGNSKATGPQDEDVVRWSCSEDSELALPDPTPGFFRRRARRKKTWSSLHRAVSAQRRALRRHLGRRASRKHAKALARLRARAEHLRMHPVIHGNLPLCQSGEVVHLSVNFPECWDGRRLDSPDHQAHLTFSVHRGEALFSTCPASHPVAVPDVQLNVRYLTRGGPAMQLSSGPEYTAHADFFDAWDPASLATLVRNCLNAGVDC
jgi:hypothetical protein